jgi:hypothetical protein
MCKGRSFALKEALMYTASIITMWEIQPSKAGAWKMPKHVRATGVYTTNDDTRVWLTRRKFATTTTK